MYWLKNNWFLFAVAITFLVYLFFPHPSLDQDIQADKELPVFKETEMDTPVVPNEPDENRLIKVDIKGEVKKPGLYEIQEEKRVSDLIKAAGGLTEGADANQVNLARKLVDEMVIYVPAVGEENQAPVAVSESPSSAGGAKVKLNQAAKEEIMTLNGIGEKKADAILAYREENGPFKSPEQLLEVEGIGEKTLENLMEMIQIP